MSILYMPSKDTIPFHLTKKTNDEIERVRKVISKEMGIDVSQVTKKQAEIAFRLKAQNGKINLEQIKDILIGKIK